MFAYRRYTIKSLAHLYLTDFPFSLLSFILEHYQLFSLSVYVFSSSRSVTSLVFPLHHHDTFCLLRSHSISFHRFTNYHPYYYSHIDIYCGHCCIFDWYLSRKRIIAEHAELPKIMYMIFGYLFRYCKVLIIKNICKNIWCCHYCNNCGRIKKSYNKSHSITRDTVYLQ